MHHDEKGSYPQDGQGTLYVGWAAGETEAATTSSKNLIEVGATAETRVWVWSLENIMLVIIWSLNGKQMLANL